VLGKSNWKDRSKNRANGENSIKEFNVCSVIEEDEEEDVLGKCGITTW